VFGITQRRMTSQADFDAVWNTSIDVPTLVRDLGNPGSISEQESFHGAVHFIAGFLERFEFQLFRNGGLPLIERHTGRMREEIILRLGPHAIRGAYIPVAMTIHISHEGLREVRDKYWPGSGRAPISLYSANVGQLQVPATHDIWNVATEDALTQITQFTRQEVLPFLEMLASPAQMRRAILDRNFPQFNIATSLEWLLLEFGHADARQFIRQLIDQEEVSVKEFWENHDSLKKQLQIAYSPGDTMHNMAVIALSHDLCRRWLY
jgi:hypothetical protein